MDMARSILGLMAALMLVATIAPPTMAVRDDIAIALAMRERGIPIIPQDARIQQRLADIMLAAAERKVLNCIPKWNRCGPKMDGVPCCEPYTCTSDYYGNCS
ncbi:unnamed protein product [Amaranthus hypochondriacus]|nr:aplha amylase inhibitor [Amaranthus hypochondriacus]ANC73391.1 alpha amylase inhibitor [Achyranthes aspera]ANC73392.1 alpha amylase inhibitor [Celosia argentea]ANC73393.1 alpha amylase inhibitor [Amaranthus paniculatus]